MYEMNISNFLEPLCFTIIVSSAFQRDTKTTASAFYRAGACDSFERVHAYICVQFTRTLIENMETLPYSLYGLTNGLSIHFIEPPLKWLLFHKSNV